METKSENMTEIPLQPIMYQPGSGGNGHYENPKPYLISGNMRNNQDTVQVTLAPRGPYLDTLRNLGFFYIKATGQTTRAATSETGSHLFSQDESVIANNAYVVFGELNFIDNNGQKFLNAEVTVSGTRIKSHNTHLGVVDPIAPYGKSSVKVTSSIGLGTITFEPIGGGIACPCPICLVCCCCCRSITDRFNIVHNGVVIGEVGSWMEGDGEIRAMFSPNLDSRLKALIVVPSFLLYNTYWKSRF